MTRQNKASRTKVLFTILQILVFGIVMLYTDAFGSSSEEVVRPNEAFLGTENDQIGINPDNITVDISSDGDDNSILYYVVQQGDTLESVAKEFWVPVTQLKKINRIAKGLKVGQRLVVSDDEDGILYVVQTPRTLKLFAEYYRLNLDDLITLNHFADESEMLYPGQEIFVNVTEQRAYDIGLLEKAQPVLPKDQLPIKKKTPKSIVPSVGSTLSSPSGGNVTPNSTASSNKNKKQWYFNKKISNGFAAGYCTWYAAYVSPWMYDENGQRLFGGNAKDWYKNAQNERAKAAGIKVSKTNPGVWSIVVYSPLRSYAGHVAVVKAYYPESGEMLVEDMNYVGKYIVTQRWDNVKNAKIIGYIYK